jgi:hypothetical protein
MEISFVVAIWLGPSELLRLAEQPLRKENGETCSITESNLWISSHENRRIIAAPYADQ